MHGLKILRLLILLFMCAAVRGEEFDRSKFDKYELGVATKSEVISDLGMPSSESNTLDGRSVIEYEYRALSAAPGQPEIVNQVSFFFSDEERLFKVNYLSTGGPADQIADRHWDAIHLLMRLREFLDGCQGRTPGLDPGTSEAWLGVIEGTVENYLFQSRRLEYQRVRRRFLEQRASESEFAVARINYDGALERYGMRRADAAGSMRAIDMIEKKLVQCQKLDERMRIFKIPNFTSRLGNALAEMQGLLDYMESEPLHDAAASDK